MYGTYIYCIAYSKTHTKEGALREQLFSSVSESKLSGNVKLGGLRVYNVRLFVLGMGSNTLRQKCDCEQ